MNSITKSIIQIIVAITISIIMLGAIVGYFYVGYYGFPFYIILRFTFLAIIVNSIGIVILANLATVNQIIKNILYFFLGLFLSILLILGFLKNSFNSLNEAYLALVFSVMVAMAIVLYFQTEIVKTKSTIAVFLITIFTGLGIVSFFNHSESATAIQNYQVIFALVSLVALIFLFDWPRNLIKKYLGLDFSSPINIASLVLAISLLGFFFYIVLVFQNLGGFLNYATKGFEGLINTKIAFYQLLYFLGISFLGLGWLTRRNFSGVLKKLGLTLPNKKDLVLILVFSLGLYFANWLMETVGVSLKLIDLENEKQASQLILANFNSFGAMLILALGAGVGEEILFRGALQPRFGIIFTAILFTMMHGQYQIWGLLTVLVLSLILGYQRKISNTTSTITSHFLYDLAGLVIIFLIK